MYIPAPTRYRDAGDILPSVVGPRDVDNYLDRVMGQVETLDRGVRANAQLPIQTRREWSAFVDEWRTFYARNHGNDLPNLISAKAVMNETDVYQKRVQDWDTTLRQAGANLPAPKPDALPSDSPSSESGGPSTNQLLIFAGIGLAALITVFAIKHT